MASDEYEDLSGSTALGLDLSSKGVPFWGDDPGAWDAITIAGVRLPGIAEVDGDVELRVDLKETPGAKGAKHSLLGWKPSQVTVTVRVWTADQLELWAAIAKQLRPLIAKGGTNQPKPVDIYHPNLEIFGIHQVTVTKIGFLKPVGDVSQGMRSVTINALEFRYDAGTPTTPKAAEADFTGGTGNYISTNKLGGYPVKPQPQAPTPPSQSPATTGPKG